MNEQIKQRLVGALVLVSLAVIFIPMLLDGDGQNTMPRYGSNIPSQPDIDFEPLNIPLQPVATPTQPPPRVVLREEPASPEMASSTSSVTTPEPETTKPASVAKPASTSTGATSPPTQPHSQGLAEAWVVQVGSFGNSANALALRDKLRKAGFPAFVLKYQSDGKSNYRVRVGPELKRSKAESHQKRLQQAFSLKGIVMEHR